MVKNIGKNISKNLSAKYSPDKLTTCQKLLDHAKKSPKVALKTSSKRATQKTADATDNLIGNKTTDRILKVSRSSTWNSLQLQKNVIRKYPTKDIYLQEKGKKLLMI